MKIVKCELQNIITGNGETGDKCLIKKSQVYLGGNEIPSVKNPKMQYLKSEETRSLVEFNNSYIISQNGILFFIDTIFYLTDNFYKP